MKKHILVTLTIIFAVIISLFGMVTFVSSYDATQSDTGNIVLEQAVARDDFSVEPVANSGTKLTPRFYATVPGMSGDIRYDFPAQSITYRGIQNKASYFVEWVEEPTLEVDYTLNYYDEKGVLLPVEGEDNRPWKAGKYTIEVVVTTPDYYVDATQSKCDMTIKPFVCHLESISATTKVYDGMYFEPTIKFQESILPDAEAYTIEYFELDQASGEYHPIVGQPINAGEYKIALNFGNNTNYEYDFQDKDWNGTFQITPRPLTVDYIIDGVAWKKLSPIEYSGNNKDVKFVLKGWRYNVATQQDEQEIFEKDCTLNIEQKGQKVDARGVGKYNLTITTDTPLVNYILPPMDELEILPKKAVVEFVLPSNLVYDGTAKQAIAKTDDLCLGDDVSIDVLYNGQETLPTNAGEYVFSIRVAGNDKDNYSFVYDDQSKMNIQKAQYPTTDFTVSVYSSKIIISVDIPSQCTQVLYSIFENEWQSSNEIGVAAMQDYQVSVKLVESANYQEKILTKLVKTGFDSKVFADMLNKIDTDNFSFKDVAGYLEIERCFGYVSDSDMSTIDLARLEQIRACYNAYKLNAQSVVQDAVNRSKSMQLSITLSIVGVIGIGIFAIRRKSDEI